MMETSGREQRPRVICHMMTSVDGRIMVEGWPLDAAGRAQYEEVHAGYAADGWLCGRVTMEEFAGGTRAEAEVAAQNGSEHPREDFVAPGDHESYAIALDPSGRLAWKTGEIEGDHVVAIVSEQVSDEYLEGLRERGVSYLLAGRELDLTLAVRKIGEKLGVETLMLEGGGSINGSMLRAGLVDEVSVLVAPVADGRAGNPALFDIDEDGVEPRRLVLEGVEQRPGGFVWLRYRVDRAG